MDDWFELAWQRQGLLSQISLMLIGDHSPPGSGRLFAAVQSDLGSTSKVATAAGALHSQQLYKAWGESRYTSGTLPTRYTYTGQYSYASDVGLVFYGSRFYDPSLTLGAAGFHHPADPGYTGLGQVRVCQQLAAQLRRSDWALP